MTTQQVVTRAEWLDQRVALLAAEKELTRRRDELSAARRALPWVEVTTDYTFDTVEGRRRLIELFGGNSQLVVYHFMFGPDWEEGCPSCSFWADNYNGTQIHLAHRDVTLIACSRAPLPTLLAYRDRMGWTFPWVSSLGTTFNEDFGVSDATTYNYAPVAEPMAESPGLSVFIERDGKVFHTYSCYSRGLDAFNSAYQILDLTPNGRDEDDLPWTMAWLRRHDQYSISSQRRPRHAATGDIGSGVAACDPLAVAVAQLMAQGTVGTPLRHGWAAVTAVAAPAVAVVLLVVQAPVGEVAAHGGLAVARVLELTLLVEHLVLHLTVGTAPAVGRMVAPGVVEQPVGEPRHVRLGAVERSAYAPGEVVRDLALVADVEGGDDAERHRVGQQFHAYISNGITVNLS